ncbi:hypothetical protein GCM10011512_16100 [Tersicoccus solisilvae]|uniref:N-acetyltransferase domain-containing protein n=1 Tax=Tersicoccus solisilvae TaxID=1882339 RepID=A0ABQ1P425_9MICC|nr:WbqC family protein [Tersicoccus solisilvae]GGC89929.1 hypothetical protein GCM10011512_16100 [Tersicoccus solisilvae]
MSNLNFSVLEKDQLEIRLPELRAVDADVEWMTWDDAAYLRDLPRKWELSRLAERDGAVVGYALCSEKGDTVWLHRIATGRSMRGSGLGSELLHAVERGARERGFAKVSLKTPTANTDARRFYESNGYGEMGRDSEHVQLGKVLKPAVVGVHQPNYLPWLGYFYKLSRSDTFVILDDVLAPSRGYFNRSKVLVQGQGRWMTVPVHRNDGYIHHMTTADGEWVAKHLGTLRHNYQNAPFYDELMPELGELIERHSVGRLAELNEALISHVAGLLGITTPCVRSSRFALETKGDQRLVDLVAAVGGSSYLSGNGGDNYQEAETFGAAGLELVYTGFTSEPYGQQHPEFVPGLSAVDALFNIGPAATRQLIDDAPAPQQRS